jgi:hypothetical protein
MLGVCLSCAGIVHPGSRISNAEDPREQRPGRVDVLAWRQVGVLAAEAEATHSSSGETTIQKKSARTLAIRRFFQRGSLRRRLHSYVPTEQANTLGRHTPIDTVNRNLSKRFTRKKWNANNRSNNRNLFESDQ